MSQRDLSHLTDILHAARLVETLQSQQGVRRHELRVKGNNGKDSYFAY